MTDDEPFGTLPIYEPTRAELWCDHRTVGGLAVGLIIGAFAAIAYTTRKDSR